MLHKIKLRSFRQTVSLLVWVAVAVPIIISFIYQIRTDYQRQVNAHERELIHETERLSFSLTQNILQLMSDLDRIASDGSVIRSLSMPIFTPISIQKIEAYLDSNPAASSVKLIDKELFPIEVLPSWALMDDLSVYEPYMAEVVSSPLSVSDPRSRMFIPPVVEGEPQKLIFIRPVLTGSTSLSKPFLINGLLLVDISIEKLLQNLIEKHQQPNASVRLFNKERVLYGEQIVHASLHTHQTSIILGLDNQSLALEFGRPVEGVLTEVMLAYRTQAIVVLLFVVLMLVVIKRLADKLVRPLQLLSEVTASMSNSDFRQGSVVVNANEIQYREFSEVFELLREMEAIIGKQFHQLHEANATLEEKVSARTEALEKNIQLLDRQRNALQRLVQYSVQVHQCSVLDELGVLSLELAQGIGQQPCGLYLLRNEFFKGGEYWQGLNEPVQEFLREHRTRLNDYSSVMALMQANEWLQVFPVGGKGVGYQGFLITQRSSQSEYAGEALMVLSTMMSSAISQFSLNARLHRLAHIDSVTGLPNRHFFNTHFQNQVAQFNAEESSTHFGVFVVDANGLKVINDKYGHQYGDKMLITIAQALKQTLRANDIVARIGGDEFCILLASANSETCAAFAERVVQRCSDLQMHIEGQTMPISFSIGYACTDQDSLKNLLALADERMYFAKKKYYAQPSH